MLQCVDVLNERKEEVEILIQDGATLTYIAKVLGYSPGAVSTVFQEVFGMNYTQARDFYFKKEDQGDERLSLSARLAVQKRAVELMREANEPGGILDQMRAQKAAEARERNLSQSSPILETRRRDFRVSRGILNKSS